ncbi:hypothetical protein H6P81_001184 [Aristolochia fimbriata]|uniref:Uncharacterized protein n=1 Tax=Aristolochia fimbriata TaxID=158543 RepID=A0AAV7FA17_ARIFI|nr:hypothetical protein H6P81_001184 [Aristolochia fimbriata]
MQTGRSAAEGMKEKASNVGAAAKSGMDKTKASMEEKADKMRAHGGGEKEMAREKRDQRQAEAEMNKQEKYEENAAQKEAARPGGTVGHTHTGATGPTTGHGTAGSYI